MTNILILCLNDDMHAKNFMHIKEYYKRKNIKNQV